MVLGLGQKNAVIGLDIGSHEIKAIELTRSGDNFLVSGFAIGKISNPTDQKYAIKEVIRRGGFRTKKTVSAVSGRSVIVRYVNMLRMSEEDLRSSIRFEADKYIPFEVDDVILDCQILDTDEASSDEMKVLLVAAKRNMIKEHVEQIKEAGLVLTVVDYDAFALGNAFELRNLNSPLMEEQDRVVALIDIGASKTNINILKGNVSFFTREVYLAGNDFTEAIARRLGVDSEEAEKIKCDPGDQIAEVEDAVLPSLDDLGNEIHLSFDFYETQFEREVDDVFVSGGSSRLPGLERAFERIFEKKINFWDPLESLQILEDRVDINLLKETAPQLAIAVGLAARMGY
ncbi:MAG: type IV pilus assembly protein PilM [Planctomycetota bacterium]|nr:MAG: type IV pilus assembly protein PilM [Planctomycetota bacterium]